MKRITPLVAETSFECWRVVMKRTGFRALAFACEKSCASCGSITSIAQTFRPR